MSFLHHVFVYLYIHLYSQYCSHIIPIFIIDNIPIQSQELPRQCPVDPRQVCSVLHVRTRPNSLVDGLHCCLFFRNRFQETKSVAKGYVQFFLGQVTLSFDLLLVELLQRDFSCVVEDEWCLNNNKSTNYSNSVLLLALMSTRDMFQKT